MTKYTDWVGYTQYTFIAYGSRGWKSKIRVPAWPDEGPVLDCRLLVSSHNRTANCACIHAQLLQSYLTLCKPMDCSLPGSSAHLILQARILKWVAMPSSREFSQPSGRTCSSCIAGGFFTPEPPGKPLYGYFILLIYVPVLKSILYCPDDCGFIMTWNQRVSA